MSKNRKVRRYVGLTPGVDKVVTELAANETKGRIGPLILKLIKEALRTRGRL